MTHEQRLAEALTLLEKLIATPSPSRSEAEAADVLEEYLIYNKVSYQRLGNNLVCLPRKMDEQKQTLLLNAHIDTVKPASGWQHDPFTPTWEGERLYGLGSNDDGGSLVCLLHTFLQIEEAPERCPYNVLFVASAEEEVSGKGGLESVIPTLPHIHLALVGEPTGMHPAIAEKGLMVLDVTAHGRAGHAARNEGDNAIYRAMRDMEWFRTYRFEKESPLLGPVKMSVTIVNAGTQHNVVPDTCTFTVDIRSNECYTNHQLFDFICAHTENEVKARSFRLGSSHIASHHPLIERLIQMGRKPFGSPTLSDQALMPWPSFKMGPGDSARSHTADEYIVRDELAEALAIYEALLCNL